MTERLLTEFEAVRERLQATAVELTGRLEGLIRDAKIPVHSVTSRVKAPQSLARKLARPDRSYARLWDVTDLLGLRVETYFEDHVEAVARLIEQHFAVDFTRSSARERQGYRSVHYICAHPTLNAEFEFEVQLRTVLQHAWAEVEHDLGYKAEDPVPDAIRRRFTRVAALLEIADQEFVSIRRELEVSRERARAMLARSEGELPLDLVSLDLVTRQHAIAQLDAEVSRVLGLPLTDTAFFPRYLVRFLNGAGLETTTELTRAVEQHGPLFAAGVTKYVNIARSALQFDAHALKGVERGYGLLILAHLVVVNGRETGLNKVARFARIYRELEPHHDDTSAQRLATALVNALG